MRDKKGITLIALVITIIVMLILVSVTISIAVNGGLFGYASNAVKDTKTAIKDEQKLDEYIESIMDGPDGMYVGNTKMTNRIWLQDPENPSSYYNSQGETISVDDKSLNEGRLSMFFMSCYDEEDPDLIDMLESGDFGDTVPTFNEALEIAGRLGINKEIVRWANNNKGSRVSNVQAPCVFIDPTNTYSADLTIPMILDIIDTNDKNFQLEISIYIQTSVVRETDAETGDSRWIFGEIVENPENIALSRNDENGPFSEVELPFGIELKYMEYGEPLDDYINNMRSYIVQNLKIVNNGNEWSYANAMADNTIGSNGRVSVAELFNVLGITNIDNYFEALYRSGEVWE